MSDFKIENGKFQFVPAELEANEAEFESVMEEYETSDIVDKTEVIIYTHDYRVRGKISLVPGARLTDYMVEAKAFLAVTDAEIHDKQGALLLKSPFLDINRDYIVLIVPAELAQVMS
ncbi:hypothetical protein U14_04794 [Candidatus Moduliflexus flocculans]|uniref:Uncharacterized protein n=1 Tax=Candidatus Moduliflexus flocculans TaxID=1499966 RepID=A0A0S6W551_9BACT|nr:hypothetical protein U14_04794 [Candidatus Moduliflexus flocculans]